ncbi:MAG TPA: topoisomerase DNA-binding C4 zinc finger domain-containing protein, partial [Chloroflexota bacterium]|nr:topoisomerase DNA-binding C4 zinc finger domain-containing protein [Chloroflexota bacterium]
ARSATRAAGAGRTARGARAKAPAGASAGTVACPQCGAPLVQRVSQFGPFLGCSGYPACRYIHRAPGSLRSPPGPPSPAPP